MKESLEKTKKIIEKGIDKGGFLLEFIIVLTFMLLLYTFITTKKYNGYWAKDILIWLIPMGIIGIILLLYQIKQYHKIIEKLFVTIAIPIGIMYLVFMLPGYTPDAAAHTWRAYEVSKGQFLGRDDSKVEVPKVIEENRENIVKYNQFNNLLEKKTDYTDTVETPSPAKSYSFLLYLASGTGLLIGRIFHLNIFVATYIARSFNLIIFLIARIFYYSKNTIWEKSICSIYANANGNPTSSILFGGFYYEYIHLCVYRIYTIFITKRRRNYQKRKNRIHGLNDTNWHFEKHLYSNHSISISYIL